MQTLTVYTVADYVTGQTLKGGVTPELVEASLAADPTGAVAGRLVQNVWTLIAHSERTDSDSIVFVEESPEEWSVGDRVESVDAGDDNEGGRIIALRHEPGCEPEAEVMWDPEGAIRTWTTIRGLDHG